MLRIKAYFISALLLAYIIYNSTYGMYGLRVYFSIDKEIAEEKKELARLQKMKNSLRNRIRCLRGPDYSEDYVKELMKKYFGLVEKGEYVILLNKDLTIADEE